MKKYNVEVDIFLVALGVTKTLSKTFFSRKVCIKTDKGKIPLEKLNLKQVSVNEWNDIHIHYRNSDKTAKVLFEGLPILFGLANAGCIKEA